MVKTYLAGGIFMYPRIKNFLTLIIDISHILYSDSVQNTLPILDLWKLNRSFTYSYTLVLRFKLRNFTDYQERYYTCETFHKLCVSRFGTAGLCKLWI